MRQMRFDELGATDYAVTDLHVDTWYWHNGACGDLTQQGRTNNVLLYLLSGRREYLEGGRRVAELTAGTLNFIPVGHRYEGRALCEEEDSYGYVFEFHLMDADGQEILVNQPYYQVHDSDERGIYLLCQRLGDVNRAVRECSSLVKASVYELLSLMCGDRERLAAADHEYADIAPAIRQMRAFPERHAAVQELSAMCRMSEGSFRRRFARYSGGLTPVEYRSRLLCDKAEQLYRTRESTLEEIAERLGFCDAAYLCRVYKRVRGTNFRDISR